MAAKIGRPAIPFWSRVQMTGNICECWLWKGPLNSDGYGRAGKKRSAHRYSYVEQFGKIPDGLELDHLCSVRSCVNPWHLEPVTKLENIIRSQPNQRRGEAQRNRTHCSKGHLLSGDNVRNYGQKSRSKHISPGIRVARRFCMQCNRDNVARYMAKKKGIERCPS